MSLFEKLQNKRYNLQEAPIDDKGRVTAGPDDVKKEKKILKKFNKKQEKIEKKNIKTNTQKGDELLQDINKRVTAQDRQQQLYNRQYDAYDDGDIGNPNDSKGYEDKTKTTTKTVNQAEVSKDAKEFTKKINKKNKNLNPPTRANYPKTRPELIAKRKEYGIDRKGNISDAGVERYARKTKQLSSGSNLPVKITQADKDLAKKRAVGTGVKGTDVGKYGGKLGRTRNKNMDTFAQVKAKIDAKNPTYKSPLSGGKLPIKISKNLSKYDSPVDKVLKDIENVKKAGPQKVKEVEKALRNIPDDPKLPRTVLTKTKPSKAFPLGLKPVDTKTKEGEKIARRVTKKFVTDKELTTGSPPEIKPPKSSKPSLFSRTKNALKGFHKFMVKDANFRKTSGSGRLMKDTLGQIARDKNMTRNIFKNTMRGNTLRTINKFLPGKYKALAALATGTYLATRGKKKDGTGGASGGKKKFYRAVEIPMGFDSKSSSAKKIYDPKNPNKYK